MHFKLIAGLGNPGAEYERTYHNAGARFVDFMLRDTAVSWKEGTRFSYVERNGILFVKSGTYMNESGIAISNAARYFKISPEDVLIAHDDADQELGRFLVRFDGGAGGHHGIESVAQMLGTNEFWRVKLGVRTTRPGVPRVRAGDFVLRRISDADEEMLQGVFGEAEKSVAKVIENVKP